MIIAVDVDDVIVDLVPRWVKFFNEISGENIDHTKINDWMLSEMVKKENVHLLFSVLKKDDLYDNIPLVENSIEIIDLLVQSGHRVIFVTAGSHPKKEKLLEDIGLLKDKNDYVYARDKGLIRADILIDDGVHNIMAFKGTGIIFTRPWNKSYNARYRVDNWKQAGVFLGLRNLITV